jgi:hypothetical protein
MTIVDQLHYADYGFSGFVRHRPPLRVSWRLCCRLVCRDPKWSESFARTRGMLRRSSAHFFEESFDAISLSWLNLQPLKRASISCEKAERFIMATKLLPLRPSGSALRSMSKRRPSQHTFSTSSATAALSPHSKSNKKIASKPTKRTQATAAAPAPYGYLAGFVSVQCVSILTVAIQTNKTNSQSCFQPRLSKE